jgi:hypothetical protein
MTDEEKSIKALVESGEIEKYSKEYFRQQGKIGLKKYLRTTTKKQRSERAFKAWETKRSYPQE